MVRPAVVPPITPVGERLRTMSAPAPAPRPSGFLPAGPKPEVLRLALREYAAAHKAEATAERAR